MSFFCLASPFVRISLNQYFVPPENALLPCKGPFSGLRSFVKVLHSLLWIPTDYARIGLNNYRKSDKALTMSKGEPQHRTEPGNDNISARPMNTLDVFFPSIK